MPVHPPGKSYSQVLREDRDAIVLADQLGYTEAYVGEHVTDIAEPVTDSALFLASLGPLTHRIRLCTGTVNLPNAHPATVAAKIAMLDHLLEGRFGFGISVGGLASDWEMFGTLEADRRAMFAESINHILAIWEGNGPIARSGDYWTLSTVRTALPEIGQGLMVKPRQLPHPPIVVTAAEPASRSVAYAAERGWQIISAQFLLPEWVRSHWETYARVAAESGRMASREQWRVAKTIFVADDTATARAYAFGPNSPYRAYFDQLGRKLVRAGRINLFKPSQEMPDELVTTDYLLERLVIAGTAEQVADRIVELVDVVGEFGTLLYCGVDWVDPALSRTSMELFATAVMPEVTRRLERRPKLGGG
jgi:alkanesulfonate monooxygenase SsuD/methylene tetrahydromethanopterin reductase-like flavin-dependent oxidoreductase (luciferase family)